ncbi:MAG: hypothetical protein Q8Q31_04235 [Nanoarchaeota archaeon]|nr:hypothetical protein [Nanoarchaeota archaeon]
MTSYKGTVTREQLNDLLTMLFPQLPGRDREEIMNKGIVPPKYNFDKEEELARTTSKLELSIYPYAPDPIILIKDDRGTVRALEFHAANHSPQGVYEIYEICREGAELMGRIPVGEPK